MNKTFYSIALAICIFCCTRIIIMIQDIYKRTNFRSPFFHYSKVYYKQTLEDNRPTLGYFLPTLWYDSAFAIMYGISYWSLMNITSSFITTTRYTIPLHVTLDWLENLLLYSIIIHYQTNGTVQYNVEFFVISTLKWFIAFFHTGISLYAIYDFILTFIIRTYKI